MFSTENVIFFLLKPLLQTGPEIGTVPMSLNTNCDQTPVEIKHILEQYLNRGGERNSWSATIP